MSAIFSWGHPGSVSAELYHNEYIIHITESFSQPVSYENHQGSVLTLSSEMAWSNNYMVPMFSIPQVTWTSQSAGQASLGKFPNPRSVMKICKFRGLALTGVMGHCDTVALWHFDTVTMWHCTLCLWVALWHWVTLCSVWQTRVITFYNSVFDALVMILWDF